MDAYDKEHPHNAPFQAGLELARRVMATSGIRLTEDELQLVGSAILSGFAASGGLKWRSRKSLERAAAQWADLGSA